MIRHCYGVLRVNSFAIETVSGGTGRALFPVTALISHSCQPNVLHDPKAVSPDTIEKHNGNSIQTEPQLPISNIIRSLKTSSV